jgi:hypothetical protein
MLYYDLQGKIQGQLAGHNNILEIYAHLYAAIFLFVASLVAIAIVHHTLKKTVISGSAIKWGLLYVGLIGLGESLEHLPFLDLYLRSMAHYLHLLSAPLAVLALYLGMRETMAVNKGEIEKIRTFSIEIGISIFTAAWVGIFIMAIFARSPWNEVIEGPFLLVVFAPTIFLVAMVMREFRHFAESTEMLYLPIISVAVSFLTIDIWIGRYADLKWHAGLYVLTHASQDVLLAATGGMVILFAFSIWYSHKIGRLFVPGTVRRKEQINTTL